MASLVRERTRASSESWRGAGAVARRVLMQALNRGGQRRGWHRDSDDIEAALGIRSGESADPLALAMACAVLLVVIAIAAYGPARDEDRSGNRAQSGLTLLGFIRIVSTPAVGNELFG
jgi:hypothetical protein